MESFLVQLQVWGLRVLRKRDSILDVFCEICGILQNLIFFQQHFGHITCSISNESTQSQRTVCLEPPQRAVRKQIAMFVSKIFKIAKVEGNIFCGWGRRNELKRVFSRSSHPELFCKKSFLKYLEKVTRSTSAFKKETPS